MMETIVQLISEGVYMKTIIGIPSGGSSLIGNTSGKKAKISIDTDRLQRLSEQLSELVEELDDIKEDLNEMLEEIEINYDMADYADGEEDTPYDWLQNICDTVDGAYTDLNEALDEMEIVL